MSIFPWRKNEKRFDEIQPPKEKPELEKGDLPAILIAAFLNFVLPIMLVLAAICFLAYGFFTRFK